MDPELALEITWEVVSAKWNLWHGKKMKAFDWLEDIRDMLYDEESKHRKQKMKMYAYVDEFVEYLKGNERMLINYGAAYRSGRPISSAIAESTVNTLLGKRFGKKQQMHWTPAGAHQLLQVRAVELNGDLGRLFQRWYPEARVA